MHRVKQQKRTKQKQMHCKWLPNRETKTLDKTKTLKHVFHPKKKEISWAFQLPDNNKEKLHLCKWHYMLFKCQQAQTLLGELIKSETSFEFV